MYQFVIFFFFPYSYLLLLLLFYKTFNKQFNDRIKGKTNPYKYYITCVFNNVVVDGVVVVDFVGVEVKLYKNEFKNVVPLMLDCQMSLISCFSNARLPNELLSKAKIMHGGLPSKNIPTT